MNSATPLRLSSNAGLAIGLVLWRLCAFWCDAQTIVETHQLRAGWNSIHLGVTPQDTDPNVVFGGLEVDSVWRYQTRLTSVDFISDVDEPVWNRDQWMVHVPTNRLESLANNLFRIDGGFAYLINLRAPGTLAVTGVPFFRALPWKSDAFNLRGFPVDPAAPPTFADFFRASKAHYDSALGELQPAYRLDPSGQWQLVQPQDVMAPGIAYWTYTKGASGYVAPFEIGIEGLEMLDFDRTLNETILQVINRTESSLLLTINEMGAPGDTALRHAVSNPEKGIQWLEFPNDYAQLIAGNDRRNLRLGVDRNDVPEAGYQSVLELRGGKGTRFLLPVSVGRYSPGIGGGGGSQRGSGSGGAVPSASPWAGLWMGVVSISRVSESHSGNLITNRVSSHDGTPLEIVRVGVSTNATLVGSPFDFRALIHVDSSGQARLLQEVIQMWQDGAYEFLPDGTQRVLTPGHYVLVTEESLIPQFKGATLRDGESVGRRLSTVGYHFPPSPEGNFLKLDGQMEADGEVGGGYTLFSDLPTNPFKHKYHPDHDNLDARFKDYEQEAFEVRRDFLFDFSPTDPDGGQSSLDYGYGVLAGVYSEVVQGLHRLPIYAQGEFRLRRISEVSELNQ